MSVCVFLITFLSNITFYIPIFSLLLKVLPRQILRVLERDVLEHNLLGFL